MRQPVCTYYKVLLGLYEFIFGSAVWIFRLPPSPILQHNKEATSRSSQLTLSRLLPTKHMLPHTNYTRHMVFLFCQVTGQDRSCPVQSDTCLVKQNKNITFLAPRSTSNLVIVVSCPYSFSNACVSDRITKNETNSQTKQQKKSCYIGYVILDIVKYTSTSFILPTMQGI